MTTREAYEALLSRIELLEKQEYLPKLPAKKALVPVRVKQLVQISFKGIGHILAGPNLRFKRHDSADQIKNMRPKNLVFDVHRPDVISRQRLQSSMIQGGKLLSCLHLFHQPVGNRKFIHTVSPSIGTPDSKVRDTPKPTDGNPTRAKGMN
jgi:hypothetical protein